MRKREEPKFSQEDVDRIVKQRLARERKEMTGTRNPQNKGRRE
ncbi:hypothetical protein [Halobacillus seohaensis]|uniref:Uncharacterized protein n=1 Tax=Halobacillus seohaensis TaxID=447421 RepID=A0ABW2ENE3_9BACI